MKRRHALMSALLPLAATLAACSKQESAATATAPAAPPARRPLSVEAAAQARGFTVGAMMSANPVYVFFDAQCPHCGHLWEAAKPLLAKVKFVWVPVGLINPSSTAQGAALLAAADPMAAMNEHEASLLAKKGGLSAPGSVPPELEQAIKANTTLLGSFGAEGVPFIVAKNLKSGQVVSGEGSMPTDALAKLIGIDAAP